MTPDFLARFAAPFPADPPASLQLLFPDPPDLDPDGLAEALRLVDDAATAEVYPAARFPAAAALVSGDGPPPTALGLLEWANHRVKLVAVSGPMPYGPVETCVVPALMPAELKAEAKAHRGHVLLYYAGTHPDPREQLVALAAAAGAVARFGASVILNEEARAAVPGYDLVPDDDEDVLDTLRNLPDPYLYGGFLKLDVGDPDRPWARTFANRRLGLPELATHLTGHDATADAFRVFAGLLGYLRAGGDPFAAGDVIDLGDRKLRLREPTELEWFLHADGKMLVLEPG